MFVVSSSASRRVSSYLPAWGSGKNSRIDLGSIWANAKQMSILQGNVYPESGPNGTSVWGFLNSHWYEYWYSALAKGSEQRYDDFRGGNFAVARKIATTRFGGESANGLASSASRICATERTSTPTGLPA